MFVSSHAPIFPRGSHHEGAREILEADPLHDPEADDEACFWLFSN